MRDVVLASFLNPESILEKGGLALLALIIFAETGLLIGFFLPGDSLLFTAGLLTAGLTFKGDTEPFVLGQQSESAARDPGQPIPTVSAAGVIRLFTLMKAREA